MSPPETPSPSASVEAADAGKVDTALELLMHREVARAERILRDVVSRAPRDYVRSYEQGGTLFIKFWSAEEFVHEVALLREQRDQEIVWPHSAAYPRAFFYLGFARVAQEDPEGALRWLDAGRKLEPHPMIQLEIAKVYSSLKQYERSLGLYDEVAKMGPQLMATVRAIALRGKGFQLIELGQLGAAEQCFHDSLKLDPGNDIATHELQYIEHLRQGGRKAGTETVTMKADQGLHCTLCGGDLDNGQAIPYEGRVIWLCASCIARALASEEAEETPSPPPKKWWQFWRQ